MKATARDMPSPLVAEVEMEGRKTNEAVNVGGSDNDKVQRRSHRRLDQATSPLPSPSHRSQAPSPLQSPTDRSGSQVLNLPDFHDLVALPDDDDGDIASLTFEDLMGNDKSESRRSIQEHVSFSTVQTAETSSKSTKKKPSRRGRKESTPKREHPRESSKGRSPRDKRRSKAKEKQSNGHDRKNGMSQSFTALGPQLTNSPLQPFSQPLSMSAPFMALHESLASITSPVFDKDGAKDQRRSRIDKFSPEFGSNFSPSAHSSVWAIKSKSHLERTRPFSEVLGMVESWKRNVKREDPHITRSLRALDTRGLQEATDRLSYSMNDVSSPRTSSPRHARRKKKTRKQTRRSTSRKPKREGHRGRPPDAVSLAIQVKQDRLNDYFNRSSQREREELDDYWVDAFKRNYARRRSP